MSNKDILAVLKKAWLQDDTLNDKAAGYLARVTLTLWKKGILGFGFDDDNGEFYFWFQGTGSEIDEGMKDLYFATKLALQMSGHKVKWR